MREEEGHTQGQKAGSCQTDRHKKQWKQDIHKKKKGDNPQRKKQMKRNRLSYNSQQEVSQS